MSFEISSHCRQLVGCQMPNFFSRIAARSPRVLTASTKVLAIVSATVRTACSGIRVPSSPDPLPTVGLGPAFSAKRASHLTPRLLLFPAPFAARAGLFRPEIKFLDVLRPHQPLAGIVHDDAADLEHVAVIRRLQCDFCILF